MEKNYGAAGVPRLQDPVPFPYIDGHLYPEDGVAFYLHVSGCTSCHEMYPDPLHATLPYLDES
jgi:hypothetical protein